MRWVLILLAAASLAACGDRTPKPKVQMQTSALGAPSAQLASEVRNTQIVEHVKQALAADPELGRYVVDVDSKDGLVVIGGVAPNQAAKERASAIARDTPDVKDVINQLALKQGSLQG